MFAGDNLFTLRAANPTRPVSWRWSAARVLRDLPPGRRRPAADEYIQAAVYLQEKLHSINGMGEAADSLLDSADAADAYLYWIDGEVAGLPAPQGQQTPGEDEPPPSGPLSAQALARAEMEALILAGKSSEKVAKHTGLTPAAVKYYEHWFFDVRDRLKRPGWIAANVIGTLLSGAPSVLLPNLIRAYGYYTKSGRVVRTATTGFDAAAAQATGRDPSRFFAADAASAGSIKAALAVRLMPLNSRTYGRILELHHEAVDLEAKTKGAGGTELETKFKDAIESLTGKIERKYCAAPTDYPDGGGELKIVSSNDAG